MQQQRAHQERRPQRCGDDPFGCRFADSFDVIAREATFGVPSGHDPQRAIVGVAVVEMEANRQHGGKQARGRLDMRDAGLDRPRTPAHQVMAFSHRYREILVPKDRPIGLRRFVKKERAYRNGAWADDGFNETADRRIDGQIPHFRDVQKVAGAINGRGATRLSDVSGVVQDAPQAVDLGERQDVRHDGETVAFYGVFWLKFRGYDLSPIGRRDQQLFRSLANQRALSLLAETIRPKDSQ